MKEMLTVRWSTFSSKEKHMLTLLTLLVLCLLFYAYAWLPVQHGRERLTRTLPDKQAKLLLMQSQAAEIEQLHGQYKSLRGAAGGLRAAIEVSAKFHGLTPSYSVSVSNSDTNRIEIVLTGLSFDAWLKWVESLQNQNHVRVISCLITPEGAAGLVRVQAMLTEAELR